MEKSAKRGVSDLAGLRALRTMRSGGKRSIPRVMQGSSYLDLYMRSKEKDRLERELAHLDKRKTENEKRIAEIEKEMGVLKVQEEGRAKEEKREVQQAIPSTSCLPAGTALGTSSQKKWKTMSVSF